VLVRRNQNNSQVNVSYCDGLLYYCNDFKDLLGLSFRNVIGPFKKHCSALGSRLSGVAMEVNILEFQTLNSRNSQKQNIEIHSELATINWVKTHSINKNNSQLKTKTGHNFTVEKPT